MLYGTRLKVRFKVRLRNDDNEEGTASQTRRIDPCTLSKPTAHLQQPPVCYSRAIDLQKQLIASAVKMDVDTGTILPRGELIKTIVAAEPTAAAGARQSDDISESDDDDGPRLEYVTHLEMSCDNQQLAAALSSLEINLYSVETMALAGKVKGHTGPLTQLAFAPSDPSSFFSASEDGTVRFGLRMAARVFRVSELPTLHS